MDRVVLVELVCFWFEFVLVVIFDNIILCGLFFGRLWLGWDCWCEDLVFSRVGVFV